MLSAKKKRERPATVVIVSGGTGRTADQVVRAALAQFDEPQVQLVFKLYVRTAQAAEKIVKQAADDGALICHSLVSPKVRAAIAREVDRHKVPVVDVLGPMVSALEDYLEARPRLRPGLSYQLRREHFDRMDAVDFTLAHDDGARLHELDQADVVLVGASRVSKSVTCFYLAYRGVRAANVPLVLGLKPPDELLALEPSRVIGLMMAPQRLRAIRAARATRISNQPISEYVEVEKIAEELRYAQRLMRRHRWRSIDVSYMAVEDVAKEVIEMLAS